ncbi:MAG: hypothetical protein WDO15_11390 [Bacteroidota bacterium]
MLGVSQLDKASTALSTAIATYFESAEGSSGEKRSDQNGTTLAWRYAGAHGAIEYNGTVPLTPAA